MIVQCSKCEKKYKIDSEKVTEKGVKFTCQSCGNVMLIRKRGEDEPKEPSVPCSVCGQPASIKLDSDNPMCERCYEIEQEKAARFQTFAADEAPRPAAGREIDLSGSNDVSFDSISGGDFAPAAYSTEVLPGEGKDYFAPQDSPIKEKTPIIEKTVDFGSIGEHIEYTGPPTTTTIEDDSPLVKSPTPPPTSGPDKKFFESTPPPSQVKPPTPPPPAPPPKPAPAKPTPPPKQAAPAARPVQSPPPAKPPSPPAQEKPQADISDPFMPPKRRSDPFKPESFLKEKSPKPDEDFSSSAPTLVIQTPVREETPAPAVSREPSPAPIRPSGGGGPPVKELTPPPQPPVARTQIQAEEPQPPPDDSPSSSAGEVKKNSSNMIFGLDPEVEPEEIVRETRAKTAEAAKRWEQEPGKASLWLVFLSGLFMLAAALYVLMRFFV